jgi:hypothetical protein
LLAVDVVHLTFSSGRTVSSLRVIVEAFYVVTHHALSVCKCYAHRTVSSLLDAMTTLSSLGALKVNANLIFHGLRMSN